ncbi:MAG: AAA family ATPase [Gemmatimonadetes bacterium]|nr:AAA family ATPase [Gemmatimonadota bacterium]
MRRAVLLRELTIDASGRAATYPFSVPAVQAITRLEFTRPVTCLVGENGSGKSTLLEGLAVAARLPTVGSVPVARDPTLRAARELGSAMRLAWSGERSRTHRGFFLRAEDFFGFTKALAKEREELLREMAEVDVAYADRSAEARTLKLGPLRSSLAAMERRYGTDLDASSHGESFLALFRSRFVPGGLYLLDEPEAPLSPTSQLAMLVMLQEMVAQDAQFIIATHSPILLAYPDAEIWSFDERPPRTVPFDELEHVRVTRDFLAAPERYLRHLRHQVDS